MRVRLILFLLVACGLSQDTRAASRVVSETTTFLALATNAPVVWELWRVTRVMTNTLLTNVPPRTATNAAFQRMFPTEHVHTNRVFQSFLPKTLNHLIWTNFIAHTNGRDMRIWATRIHPADWPTNPPAATWNTNSLIWGMKGLTALSPSWTCQGGVGQNPLTALTRRHAYARGHGMGTDGPNTNFAGQRVWFLTADNLLVEAKVKRDVVRTTGTNQLRQDYTILLLDRDLPETITPMAVAPMEAVQKFYLLPTPGYVPYPIFQTEQGGSVSTSIEPLKVNTWKPGDSGSPNMIPLLDELVFFGGRSTSGPTREMQADMDELCRLEGLNPAKYQMRWVDLGKLTSK